MIADRIHTYEPLWGEWKVEAQIGSGSYGRVYVISRDCFGSSQRSAMKFISLPQADSDAEEALSFGTSEETTRSYLRTAASNLMSEIQMMSFMKGNSHIVSIEDFKAIERTDAIGWDFMIRMELLQSLPDLLQTQSLTRRDVVRIGTDICRALETCQKFKIVHRDVKPANIFISPLGDYKLGDFGIARQLDWTNAAKTRRGTVAYMAPEIYFGKTYDATVDTYSLGLVLYRLLNDGRAPFLPSFPNPITVAALEESVVLRMSGMPLPLPAHAEGQLAHIVRKACAFVPSERFAAPESMRAALETVAFSEEESPVNVAASERSSRSSSGSGDASQQEEIYSRTVGMPDASPVQEEDAGTEPMLDGTQASESARFKSERQNSQNERANAEQPPTEASYVRPPRKPTVIHIPGFLAIMTVGAFLAAVSVFMAPVTFLLAFLCQAFAMSGVTAMLYWKRTLLNPILASAEIVFIILYGVRYLIEFGTNPVTVILNIYSRLADSGDILSFISGILRGDFTALVVPLAFLTAITAGFARTISRIIIRVRRESFFFFVLVALQTLQDFAVAFGMISPGLSLHSPLYWGARVICDLGLCLFSWGLFRAAKRMMPSAKPSR